MRRKTWAWLTIICVSMVVICELLFCHTARAHDPPAATTVQLPTFGVAVDADGVLSLKLFEDPGGKLRAERLAAAKAQLPGNVLAPAKLR